LVFVSPNRRGAFAGRPEEYQVRKRRPRGHIPNLGNKGRHHSCKFLGIDVDVFIVIDQLLKTNYDAGDMYDGSPSFPPLVSYHRVSTERQGRSGLGLEAQKRAVADYLNGGQWKLLREFVEIESGRRKDRPQLKAALELCRREKATLVIAKLDRLARNVAFVATLLEGKVKFVAADMPEADSTMLHIYSAMAEREAIKISERTKAALAAAKARGAKLGWAIPSRRAEQKTAAQRGAASNRDRARQFAGNVLPIVKSIRDAGITSLAGIAGALNARGIPTAREGKWYAATVRNLIVHE
jgi:DNA invertase Pin-like site-specific DNA recombinase